MGVEGGVERKRREKKGGGESEEGSVKGKKEGERREGGREGGRMGEIVPRTLTNLETPKRMVKPPFKRVCCRIPADLRCRWKRCRWPPTPGGEISDPLES